MPQYDVYRNRSGNGLLVDCQSDLLRLLPTRLVIPLVPERLAPDPLIRRLQPRLGIEGEAHVLMTDLTITISRAMLGRAVASLSEEAHRIVNAVDYLISGY